MSSFINYSLTARDTERAIVRAGLALGLDWRDETALRSVVKEALDRRQGLHRGAALPRQGAARLRLNLCALLVLMRRIELALDPASDYAPGPSWQALSRVLDQELAGRLAG
ncbi:hypothetical protein CLD22_21125 [Rubrivivax gelatinosus]|nr:hypothetical protein [Rubrivivax gelatinosus]